MHSGLRTADSWGQNHPRHPPPYTCCSSGLQRAWATTRSLTTASQRHSRNRLDRRDQPEVLPKDRRPHLSAAEMRLSGLRDQEAPCSRPGTLSHSPSCWSCKQKHQLPILPPAPKAGQEGQRGRPLEGKVWGHVPRGADCTSSPPTLVFAHRSEVTLERGHCMNTSPEKHY